MIMHLPNSNAYMVVLEISWTDDDVAWLNDLVGLERLRNKPPKLRYDS